VFHGREEDVQRLTSLILRERLVILFSKSGIGKTSLLQAGVAPELERQEFTPVFFRADKPDVPILDSIGAVLAKHQQVSGRDTTGEDPGKHQTLWEQMKRLEFDLNGLPATPVLVFDQFEEVFTLTHSDQSRHDFLSELADLANETMPEAIRTSMMQRYQQGDPAMTVDMMQWWERQSDLRIILSIRSDFLHLVDQVSPMIPGILRNRYQLQPLSREKARVAIVQPAKAPGDYISPPFEFNEPALSEMVEFLAGEDMSDKAAKEADDFQAPKKKDEIESVNLQIICQDIEEKVIDWQKPAGYVVEPEFYGNLDGLRASIRNFYINQLQSFPKAYVERILQKTANGIQISDADKQLSAAGADTLQDIAQRLIEENLVTSGNRRNSVVDDTLLDEYKVTPDFLDTLVDKSRLLRKEPRLDDFYYEISHDTLLPAIIESRDSRRQDERVNKEKADLEAKLVEEAKRREGVEAELRTAQQNRLLARKISYALSALVVLMIIFIGWVAMNYVKSIKEILRDAQSNERNELFGAAIPTYEKLNENPRHNWVLKTFSRTEVKDELAKSRQLEHLFDVVTDSLQAGDALFFNKKDFVAALRAFHHAQDTLVLYDARNDGMSPATDTGRAWRVNPVRIHDKNTMLTQRIENARQIMINQFKIAQRDFETFNEARVWNLALLNLQKMHRLLPTHPDDISALRNELNLNDPPRDFVTRELARCKNQLQSRGVTAPSN
jgi:hypothetical protein